MKEKLIEKINELLKQKQAILNEEKLDFDKLYNIKVEINKVNEELYNLI